jgi:hypothetical protein
VTRQWTRGVAFERARSTARPRGEKEGRRGWGPAVGVPRGVGAVMGPGPDRREAHGSSLRPAGVRDVRRAVVAGRTEERRRGLTGGPRHSAGRWCR